MFRYYCLSQKCHKVLSENWGSADFDRKVKCVNLTGKSLELLKTTNYNILELLSAHNLMFLDWENSHSPGSYSGSKVAPRECSDYHKNYIKVLHEFHAIFWYNFHPCGKRFLDTLFVEAPTWEWPAGSKPFVIWNDNARSVNNGSMFGLKSITDSWTLTNQKIWRKCLYKAWKPLPLGLWDPVDFWRLEFRLLRSFWRFWRVWRFLWIIVKKFEVWKSVRAAVWIFNWSGNHGGWTLFIYYCKIYV